MTALLSAVSGLGGKNKNTAIITYSSTTCDPHGFDTATVLICSPLSLPLFSSRLFNERSAVVFSNARAPTANAGCHRLVWFPTVPARSTQRCRSDRSTRSRSRNLALVLGPETSINDSTYLQVK
ncbi:hypothetical protein ElyMa_004326400 [Elysia marginata]|uniref:Uncharacterized protein n=1 Tax=Elysia marginata TaxID=1093978 RepID=A0AAV4H0K1_9GAST|nr:hypothetical protein ElyMa_004326400 [Elysia marginata]